VIGFKLSIVIKCYPVYEQFYNESVKNGGFKTKSATYYSGRQKYNNN